MNTNDFLNYKTHPVSVGNIFIGGDNKIALQSMTNTPTLDVNGTFKQVVRIYEAGADLVRISVKNNKEIPAFEEIIKLLRRKKIHIPIIADIHFSASLALKAAKISDKIRINPGNYHRANKKETIDDDLIEYMNIRNNIIPLIEACRKYNCAIRIGTNHGSLSPRIIKKYGVGCKAMVEATMEFVRVIADLGFYALILSLKSSSVSENIIATRMLVAQLKEEGYSFPIHLGVTEAGFGFAGRIKSAIGTGVLLADNIGNTIRVSLTEPPEKEIPVASALTKLFNRDFRKNQQNYFETVRKNKTKKTKLPPLLQILAKRCPVITDNHKKNDTIAADIDSKEIIELLSKQQITLCNKRNIKEVLKSAENNVFIIETAGKDSLYDFRELYTGIVNNNISPTIIWKRIIEDNEQNWQLRFAAEFGSLLIDETVDACWVSAKKSDNNTEAIRVAFEVLQACGIRKTHADFISCPSCNRTEFDIENIANNVWKATSHLSHLKIAVMGCMVNGPGEMGDADYGFIGQGKGLVTIYHKNKIFAKNIEADRAIEILISIIKKNGDWIDLYEVKH